jgi:hypothetical protein
MTARTLSSGLSRVSIYQNREISCLTLAYADLSFDWDNVKICVRVSTKQHNPLLAEWDGPVHEEWAICR